MKHVDVVALENAKPIVTKMDRRAKLLHWAALVRKSPHSLAIFHNLEHWGQDLLDNPHNLNAGSAFALAVADPTFQEQGLKKPTIAAAIGFFELTRAQLHEFSCDCGGAISNKEMARRIENIAGNGDSKGGAAPGGGFLNRMFGG